MDNKNLQEEIKFTDEEEDKLSGEGSRRYHRYLRTSFYDEFIRAFEKP